jgi:hypothetical protein
MLSASTVASLNEAYSSMYEGQIDEEVLAEELDIIESFVEEIVFELIDEGYDVEEIEESFDDELIEEVIIEAKVTYGSDTESPEERRARDKAKVGEKRSAARKAAVKGAVKTAGEKAKEVKSEVGRRAGNVAVRAKAGATRAAMKATGVSPMDVPTKAGKQRKSADTFVAGRKADRDAAKKVMGAKVKAKAGEVASKAKAKAAGVAVDATLAGSAAKKKAKETASAAKSAAKGAASSAKGAVKNAASGAKRGLKGLIRRGAEKVAKSADRLATRMGEEVETYDVVVEFLCDYGIAEDLQEAQWMMVNEVDSEDIATILEAYGQPMSKRQEYLTKKVGKMNANKSGSAHTSVSGKQSAGAALDRANKSAMQMRGR